MFDQLVTETIELRNTGVNINTAAIQTCQNLSLEECGTALRESGGIRSEKRLNKKLERAAIPENQQDRFAKYTITHLRNDVATIVTGRITKLERNKQK